MYKEDTTLVLVRLFVAFWYSKFLLVIDNIYRRLPVEFDCQHLLFNMKYITYVCSIICVYILLKPNHHEIHYTIMCMFNLLSYIAIVMLQISYITQFSCDVFNFSLALNTWCSFFDIFMFTFIIKDYLD